MDISLLLQDISRRFAYRDLICDGESRLNYATTVRRACSVSRYLRDLGCVSGSQVLVISRGRQEFIEVLLGCVQAGIQFLPASARESRDLLLSIIRHIKPAVIFLDLQTAESIGNEIRSFFPVKRVVTFGSVPGCTQYSRITRKREPFVAEAIPPETPVIGMLMEGRIIENITYGDLLLFLERCEKKSSPNSCMLLCMPYLHTVYAIEIFSAIARGLRIILLSHVTPKNILKAVSKYMVTELLMTPSLLLVVGRDTNFFGGDLRSVRELRLGQSYVGPKTARIIKQLFDPTCIIVKTMGRLSPYSKLKMAVKDLNTEGDFLHAPINSMGCAVPDLEISALDCSGKLLPAGKYGILSYRRIGQDTSWTSIGETGYVDGSGYVFLDCHNLPQHIAKPDCISQVLPGNDRVDDIAANGYPFPLEKFDEMMDNFSLAERETDPSVLRVRLASFILRNIQIPLAAIGIVFPLRTVNMKLNTADVMNEIDSSSVFYKLPERFYVPTRGGVHELSCDAPEFPADVNLLYYPLHSAEGRLVGEVYFGLQGRHVLNSLERIQAHICLRYLTFCLTSVERRLWFDTMLALITESLDMVSDGVGISDVGESPALLYANRQATQLIQLGKQNPMFGALLERNQALNMNKLKRNNQEISSSSFFYKTSNDRKLWVNYTARLVHVADDEYAVCISNTQQENPSVDHLSGLLSDREIAVLELICAGLTNKEAAERLAVSDNTIKYHLSHIYTKLGVKNRAELLASTSLRRRTEQE